MGKKVKGGRRQILQLEEKKPPKVSSKPKLKSLIHYSDSDDDSKKSNESDSAPSSTAQNKDATPLESEIAVFLKEIDALSVPEELVKEPDKASCKTETVNENIPKTFDSDAALDLPTSTNTEDSQSDAPKAYCPWQEICDSSTGYNYYWNVETNEVTWDCPPEYTAHIQSSNACTEEATHAAPNDQNNEEKENKKKNDIVVPEGAIIPISYFGDTSSSEDSSDSESELTNKNTNSEKSFEVNENTIVKNVESETKSNEEETSEVKSPSLPHCFQFPQCEPVLNHTDSQTTVSQNDAREDGEVDSSLPLETLDDVTEKPSPSDLDELPAELSNDETSGENSLKDTEKKSVQLDEKTAVKSPDSTMKKGENSPYHNAYQDKNSVYGFRPVVEYDNFTDEEEEICVASISSSEPNTEKKSCEIESSSQQEKGNVTESPTKQLVETESKISSFKRKASDMLKECTKKEELIKKPKSNDVNIDSLFASHSSYGKYGFGFGWKRHIDEENDEFLASTQKNKTYKRQSEFKTVNFIKSEDILDLKSLNDEIICDQTSHAPIDESVSANTECDQSNISKQNENPLQNNEEPLEIAPIIENVKVSTDSDVGSSSLDSIKDKIDFSMLNKKRKIIKSSLKLGTTSLKIDDDLDEIDKALCEALDAKKSAKKAAEKSQSPVFDAVNTSEDILESATSVEKLEEAEPEGKDAIDNKEAVIDDILELSSEILDKVSFLLTVPSTHASFNGVFFQLQTRFVDWQAGALDSTYFMARLKELEQYIQHYETSVISGDWTYQWDRENKRYFFINTKTQHSQWTYPVVLSNQDKSSVQPQAEVGSSSTSSFTAERDDLQTVSSSSMTPEKSALKSSTSESKDNSTKSMRILESSPPPLPPGTDSPPHTPPPKSSPSKSPPSAPPDSTEALIEPEDMDLENSNDSSSFLFVSNRRIPGGKEAGASDKERSTYYVNLLDEKVKRNPACYASYVRLVEDLSATKGGHEYSINLSKSSQLKHCFPNSSDVNSMDWPRPSCSSKEKSDSNSTGSTSIITEISGNVTPAITEVPSTLTSAITEVPANLIEGKKSDTHASSNNGISSQSDALLLKPAKSGTAVTKKEKKKTKIQPGLGLKKKNLPFLVKKWQKIKEQQDREDIDSDDS